MNTPRKTMMASAALLALAAVSTAAPDLGARHVRVAPAAQPHMAAAASAAQHRASAAAEVHATTFDPSVPSAQEVFKGRKASPPETETPTF